MAGPKTKVFSIEALREFRIRWLVALKSVLRNVHLVTLHSVCRLTFRNPAPNLRSRFDANAFIDGRSDTR